jgi:hypothetical protein
MRTFLSLTTALALGPFACDSDESTPRDTADTSDTADTTGPTDTDIAEEVLEDVLSTHLTVTATFTDAVKTGQNRLHLVLEDQVGRHLAGATFAVVPSMPMHGHGSSETPVVTDLGQGEYEAFPVTFQMPGAWTVAIDATLGDLTTHLDVELTVP